MNLASSRAKQARLSVLLGNTWLRAALVLKIVLLLAVGGWLLYERNSVGWLCALFAAWPVMTLVWYAWWLRDMPSAKNAKTIDDWLEGSLLGRLSANTTPAQLASIAMRLPGGNFFIGRFGLSPNFLTPLSSQQPADTQAIWETALSLRQELGLTKVSAAVVVAALVRALPDRDKLLAQLQLKYEDILAGVRWYHHLQQLWLEAKAQRLGGGIGRDLSFGFTPLLARFARNISAQAAGGTLAREINSHRALLDQLMKQLATSGRRNAVLVGPAGAGKTTLVYALAERLLQEGAPVPRDLRYRQVMALDPATLIAHAGERGQLEALVTNLMYEAHQAQNIILFLDNAELFFGDAIGAVNLRNVLMPVLEGGGLRLILSMDEQEFLKLSRSAPGLAQQLNRITVPGLGEPETMLVCEDQQLLYEHRFNVTYMYQAMKAAYRLGQRYVADQAMPGQALKILEMAAQYANNGLVGAASVEQAVEQAYGVKVATVNKAEERQTLLNLEDTLHERMVNQSHAVSVVANALRRARSGVRNQNRPMGSFLFLGPTGVGKTELAKALAAAYFGGEDRLVRLDLNEFGQATDAKRLIASAATDTNSLTAQITKQPFSVVLLDEIEKAHPNVLNVLLQLLDEGLLRDETNRAVSFRDAIIIATSNAGADKIRAYISQGKQPDQFEDEFVNQLIDSGQFRPEFLNRFDEITVFRPLTESELLQVVDFMLASVNKTLAQQNISVAVDTEAKRKLVQVGIDPRLGARPLRRVVQRTVENIVAKQLLAGEVAPGATLQVHLQQIEEALKQ